MNPIERLTARSLRVVRGKELVWKARALSPSEAAELQVGLAMLRAAAEPKDAESRRKGVEDLPPSAVVSMVGHMGAIACFVVQEASTDGEEFYPIRLVTDFSDHNPEATPPRIFVGSVDASDIAMIAAHVTEPYRRATEAAAPFRSPADAPEGAGLAGETVRQDPA